MIVQDKGLHGENMLFRNEIINWYQIETFLKISERRVLGTQVDLVMVQDMGKIYRSEMKSSTSIS